MWIWLAVDRNRNQVVDFEVGDRSGATYARLAYRLKKAFNIKYLCTYHYSVYTSCKIAEKHVQTKSETALVESKNSLIRHYLARFHRKTKHYSKAIDMIKTSILILFHQDLIPSIIF